jgi:D-glycero-D-manno-heptose 1,7-bisphosphate phosphatase
MSMTRRAVFLDRDGVIIENRDQHVRSLDDVRFLPGTLQALKRLTRAGYTLVIATNQSAVGRGIISLEQANQINDRVIQRIEDHGARVDASYLCPHAPDDGCLCRKPAPGMLLQAQKDLQLDLACSYLVGDAVTDIQAAQAAGVSGILVLTGRGADHQSLLTEGGLSDCPVLSDLDAAVAYVLAHPRLKHGPDLIETAAGLKPSQRCEP